MSAGSRGKPHRLRWPPLSKSQPLRSDSLAILRLHLNHIAEKDLLKSHRSKLIKWQLSQSAFFVAVSDRSRVRNMLDVSGNKLLQLRKLKLLAVRGIHSFDRPSASTIEDAHFPSHE